MSLRRPLGVLLAGVAVTIGGVSASLLGTFEDVAFSAYAEDRAPCVYDTVTLLDGALDLVTGTILSTSELTTVELTNLTGDCVGTTPVVVVYGIDLLDPPAGEQRLFVVDQFGTLTATGDVTLPLSSPVSLGDGLALVLYDLTEARVAFCPGGTVCA